MNTLPGHYMAMALVDPASHALETVDREQVMPTGRQVLLRVATCGVCRTDLHVVDGDLTPSHLPRVPGHEVVGVVAALGPGCTRFRIGDRLGVP